MRLGILADIHEEIELLLRAIDALKAIGVEQFVILGDIFDMGSRLNETVAALAPLPGIGVWGNHDFGLCCDVTDHVKQRYAQPVLDYFARLHPWLEIEGCRFQHIEPHFDSRNLEDLWTSGSEGILDPARSFAACPQRRLFMGHVHRWELITEAGTVPWDGQRPVQLRAEERYLAVIHAVQQGWCAWYDSEEDVLHPVSLGA